MQRNEIRLTVLASLFTALIIIGGYISFPLPLNPVPIVLSDFFVLLAGLFLGAGWGTGSLLVFLLIGLLGFPVFAGGEAGLPVLIGPKGGYLLGFLISAPLTGVIAGKGKVSAWKDTLALIAGTVAIYACGVPWLKFVLKISWAKATFAGLVPFIPGAVIKVAAAVLVAKAIRPALQSFRSGG